LRIFIQSLNAQIGSREKWTSTQKEDLTWWGAGREKKRGTVDIFGKSEFPVSPEMQNSHWLEGDKNVITLTTVIMVACRCVLRLAAAVITDMCRYL